MGADLLEGDAELTEFTEIDVQSIKGVKSGANGFPILLMKGLPAAGPAPAGAGQPTARDIVIKAVTGGQVDEAPDISVGQQVMRLLGQAISNEAEEISAGAYGETRDVSMLGRAADIIACWIAREQAAADGKDPNAPCGCCNWCSGIGCGCCSSCGVGALMCSAADAEGDVAGFAEGLDAVKGSAEINDLPDSAFAYIEPGGKKDEDGKTTPRSKRHFPVHDEKHARLAVQMLKSSPFGSKAKGKVHAAAKKFGIDVSDTSKSAVAEGETTVQTDAQGTGSQDVAKAAEDAVTKAIAPLKDELSSVKADLAKVLALPRPGGPVLSSTSASRRSDAGDDWAAKAALYRAKADVATDPGDRAGYRELAREADEKAAKATT